ncbi:BREX system P-loop protein BrxC [Rufibacter sp. XAAS-G3-1]|uniref:BREX system P-loop protein BrxC n=1 Tax=Rufibacter sp. XAAS-G3-1 TaxID=2729134 RepID=UPI0015E71330|nr:BREX system P-loop protein BrxC [Rufibacter sp. XAAS-G3-1]
MNKNKELFELNPDENNLVNDGVVEINTAQTENGLKILRHELKTFVCEGEYQQGLVRILQTYLNHIDSPKQPAAWVSGFFGSGKSHLVKILGQLWENYEFPDGTTARSIKALPDDVNELFVELERKQKVQGKLSVAGTLKDFPAADIRYSFLQLFLNALGLPQQYHHFKFIYWAKQEGILEELKALVEAEGKDFRKEYENLFVSSTLAKCLLQLKPDFAENEAKVKENFKANFKRVETISREQLIETIKHEALPMFHGAKIPCTIIVLDEVQQFIGTDGNKTIDIQNLAQELSSGFDGKFLLVATGQNALSETPSLQPLQDRFSVKVSLSDTDVETVTRKTVLQKKATAVKLIEKRLEDSLGEISRNLAGTDFGYNTNDKTNLVADYPILPSTRKFWKKVLQAIDTAGTSGQLRSQLRIVDDSLKHVANKDVGYVIPADYIFVQKQQQLLQNALLLNETNNLIQERKAQGGDGVLESRILSAVFLMEKLPSNGQSNRLKSDENTIADLLIDNLVEPSDKFRTNVKELIKKLVEKKVLMPVDDEFKLQTKVGAEWEQEYSKHAQKLNNSSGEDQIDQLRKEKILAFFRDRTKTINILQGVSKQKRDFEVWNQSAKPNTENKLHFWVKDGWFENEAILMQDIRGEGANTPLAYAYVNKQRDQELRGEIIKFLAAKQTLDAKGLPGTPEGQQAQRSMETRKGLALQAVQDIINNICKEASIFLAGGNKVDQGNVGENIKEALESTALRQFSDFTKGDYRDWDKALTKAIANDLEAMKRIGWDKEPKDHPIATEILRFIANSTKTGKEIRNHFTKSPYGWSQDAIDTIILMLRLTEHISTPETNLNQSKIGAAAFKRETHTLSALDRINIRKIYQEAGINCKSGDEFVHSNTFLSQLKYLANKVSGDSPLPEPISIQFIKDIENLDGNQRLVSILEQQEDLKAKYKDWSQKDKLVVKREQMWGVLNSLMHHVPVAAEVEQLQKEAEAVREDRLLLHESDLVGPLVVRITDLLNQLLQQVKENFNATYDALKAELEANEHFLKIEPDERQKILAKHQILHRPEIKVLDAQAMLNQLQHESLNTWEIKIAALPGQFASAIAEAVKLTQPKAKTYSTPKKTITSKPELEQYIIQLKTEIEELLESSSSVIIN